MISRLTITALPLPLSRPFSYATFVLDHLPYALVTIEDTDGVTGYGEVAAACDVTGETSVSAIGMQEYLFSFLRNRDISRLEDIPLLMEELGRYVAGNTALKAGLEATLLDLLGKKKGVNILSLFDVEAKPVVSQTVLSFSDFEPFLDGKLVLFSPHSIKVKCGGSFEKEKKVIEKARDLFPDALLNIDVNQGWLSVEEAMSHLEELMSFRLEWVEQPLRRDDVEGLKALQKKIKIPILLDESVHTLKDAILMCGAGCGDMINIKLAKCGGLFEAIKIFKWCESHRIPYILGDMLHSQLGNVVNIYAGLLGKPIVQDLTHPSRLARDPTSGVQCKGSIFFPPQGIGLGITISSCAE